MKKIIVLLFGVCLLTNYSMAANYAGYTVGSAGEIVSDHTSDIFLQSPAPNDWVSGIVDNFGMGDLGSNFSVTVIATGTGTAAAIEAPVPQSATGVLTSGNINAKLTATSNFAAYGIRASNKEFNIGNVGSEITVKAGTFAYGIASTGTVSSIGDILASANIKVSSSGNFLTLGIFTASNKIGTIYGNIEVENTAANYNAMALYSTLTNRVFEINLGGNANITAKANGDAYAIRASNKIIVNGDSNRQTLKGDFMTTDNFGITFNAGNYTIGNFKDHTRMIFCNELNFNAGASLHFEKKVRFESYGTPTLTNMVNAIGDTYFTAHTLTDYANMTLVNSDMTIDSGSKLRVVLDETFEAHDGDLMNILLSEGNGTIVGSYIDATVIWSDGSILSPEKYEYIRNANGTVDLLFKGDIVIPESSEIATLLGLLVLGFVLRRKMKH